MPQGVSADLIAAIEGFTRTRRGHLRSRKPTPSWIAIAEGRFERGIVPVTGPGGRILLDHDEHPRAGTTLEGLAKLRPAFTELGETYDHMALSCYPGIDHIDHVHHAGNSSGVVDGAAAAVVASGDWVKANGVTPRARDPIRRRCRVGARHHADCAGPAAERCLAKAGMTTGDVDLWEINEAFASVPLKTIRDLRLDPERVNVNGGAIALGHPIGATGAMLIGTVLDELERRDRSVGLVAMCTGGGMGTATIVERL